MKTHTHIHTVLFHAQTQTDRHTCINSQTKLVFYIGVNGIKIVSKCSLKSYWSVMPDEILVLILNTTRAPSFTRVCLYYAYHAHFRHTYTHTHESLPFIARLRAAAWQPAQQSAAEAEGTWNGVSKSVIVLGLGTYTYRVINRQMHCMILY